MSENHSQFLSVIRVWAALAWADDVIADQEREAMKRLIDGANLSDTERATAFSWLESKVDLETDGVAGLSSKAKEGIYLAAARLAGVDENVADEEKVFLGRLRAGLSIDEATAKKIEDQIASSSAE